MTKTELVSSLATAANLEKKQAKAFLESLTGLV